MTRTQTPEERELAAKNALLAAMEIELAQRELDFTTLRVALHAFEQEYLRVVGIKFAEIDDLKAQIAEALNRRNPTDEEILQRAVEARMKATESAGVTGAIEQRAQFADFKPSDVLKSLYREVAKRIHPDLATDEDERADRNRVMAEVNRAYGECDEERLRRILSEWETSPDAVKGEGIGAELVRTIRKIHQAEQRLASIDGGIARLSGAELSLLKARAESERLNERDLLVAMAEQLDTQILHLRRRRDALRSNEAPS